MLLALTAASATAELREVMVYTTFGAHVNVTSCSLDRDCLPLIQWCNNGRPAELMPKGIKSYPIEVS